MMEAPSGRPLATVSSASRGITPLYIVSVVGILSGVSIAPSPKKVREPVDAAFQFQGAAGSGAGR